MVMNVGKGWMQDLPANAAGTFAHELLHSWNGKAIKPASYVKWNYGAENYSPSMWFVEGVTDYYTILTLMRSGQWEAKGFVREMSQALTSYEQEPGFGFVSLASSGVAQWARPLEHLDYYAGGQWSGFLLDVAIRSSTGNRRSLDDVMRSLYRDSQQVDYAGYSDERLERVAGEIAGVDLRVFFERLIREPDSGAYGCILANAGLELKESRNSNGERSIQLEVRPDSTAQQRQLLADLIAGKDKPAAVGGVQQCLAGR
jgi:predicted metalloprotease with PDZ domain